MRNVKLLWACIALLMICMLVLIVMLVTNMRALPHDTSSQRSKVSIEDPSDPERRVVASIGNVKITESQLEQAVLEKYGMAVLEEMLDRLAVQMEGEALGIEISEEDINEELQTMQMGYDDETAFFNAMKELGLTEEKLREDIYYKLLTERIATRGIYISDELVEQYIREHPEEFQSFTQLRPQLIVVSSQQQAEQILEEIRMGTAFEELARHRSIDDLTREDGGDMGWIEENDPFVDQAIIEAVRNMKAGEIKVIQVDQGYAIIKLQARKDVNKEISKRIKEKIRTQLALQEGPSLQDLIRQLREKYHAQIFVSAFG